MKQSGFTLIELMVTVVIVAILASIALPSYQEYVRRQRLATAKQEMMVIAGELERFKTKNFSYGGFNADHIGHIYSNFNYDTNTNIGTLNVPINPARATQYTITLTIPDGYTWHMVATKTDPRNHDAFINSQGLRCQTKKNTIDPKDANPCGNDSETW